MPITPAHAAAAIPLARPLGALGSLSALIIGSMTPDLVYFLRVGLSGRFSHSPEGLLLFCLPAGVLGYALFHVLVAPVLVDLAPEPLRERIHGLASGAFAPARLPAVAVSSLLGAATHVLWDSFTHRHGFGVEALPLLRTQVPLFDGYTPRLYTLCQHASSLVGMSLLALWGARWYRRATPAPAPARRVPALLRHLLIAVLLLVPPLVGLHATRLIERPELRSIAHLRYRTARGVIFGGRALLLTAFLAGLTWWAAERAARAGFAGVAAGADPEGGGG